MRPSRFDPGIGEKRAAASVWLGVLLLLSLALKIRQNSQPFFTGIDGGLYTNIAEHVRDGEGLVTDVSPYHHGYASFPHPTAIYPLWPLTYGLLARVVPIRTAGVWAPTFGYLVALIFAYLWASTLPRPGWFRRHPRPGDGRSEPAGPAGPHKRFPALGIVSTPLSKAVSAVNPGHVLVLFLGLNSQFYAYTSLPYTEGLGFTFLFACLWRFHKIGSSTSLVSALEMGAWLAVLMLVRSQFVVVAAAAFLALGWVACRSRRNRAWLRLILAGAAYVVFLAPWYIHISGFIPHNRFTSMFRYDQARSSDKLSPFRAIVATDDVNAFLQDRLKGLKIAFSPASESGYVRIFYGLPYLLPFFFVLLPVQHFRERKARHISTDGRGRKPANFDAAFLVLFSAGSFATLQLMHVDMQQEWLFNQRHAIVMLIPLFLVWRYVAYSRRAVWTAVAGAVGVFTILASLWDCWNSAPNNLIAAQPTKAISRWLAEQGAGRDHSITVAANGLPQLLAPQVPGARFHGVYKCTTENDLRALFEELGAGRLVLEDHDLGEGWMFLYVDPQWFSSYFQQEAKIYGYAVFVRMPVRELESEEMAPVGTEDP
jgi:hypothetical protein